VAWARGGRMVGTARRRAVLMGIGLSLSVLCLITLPPPFRAGVIEVRGNHQLAAADVARLAGLRAGTPLLFVSGRRAAARLLTCPLVLEAVVRRELPGRAVVVVREAVPVAVVIAGDGWAAADERGVVVARGTGPGPFPELPRVPLTIASGTGATSLPAVGDLLPGPVRPALRLAAVLRRHAGLVIAEVRVGDGDRLQMTTRDGVRVLVGAADESLDGRLGGLVPVLEELHRAGTAVEYVDVRFRGPPAVMPGGGSAGPGS